MEKKSAYLLSEVDKAGQEVKRLSAQAQLFLDLELPLLLSRVPERAKIGDFGCGSGAIAVALADARPKAEVWGLDADHLAVAQGQALGQGRGNLQFRAHTLGKGQAAPVQGLDLAFTRLVLLHVLDPTAALMDMAASLCGQGMLYVVETDDSLMRFEPGALWQTRLLDLMERVQRSRGGSRRRGSAMGGYMEAAGLRPEAVGTVWYSKSKIGPQVFGEIFLPVVAFYLDVASRDGLASAPECASLSRDLAAFVGDPDTEISMALLHWTGALA